MKTYITRKPNPELGPNAVILTIKQIDEVYSESEIISTLSDDERLIIPDEMEKFGVSLDELNELYDLIGDQEIHTHESN